MCYSRYVSLIMRLALVNVTGFFLQKSPTVWCKRDAWCDGGKPQWNRAFSTRRLEKKRKKLIWEKKTEQRKKIDLNANGSRWWGFQREVLMQLWHCIYVNIHIYSAHHRPMQGPTPCADILFLPHIHIHNVIIFLQHVSEFWQRAEFDSDVVCIYM